MSSGAQGWEDYRVGFIPVILYGTFQLAFCRTVQRKRVWNHSGSFWIYREKPVAAPAASDGDD